MGTSKCLFSRALPSKHASKKIGGFLALPAEIRNQIYDSYFESRFRCEIAANSRQFEESKAATVKLWAGPFQSGTRALKYAPATREESSLTLRISRPLGNYNIVKGLQTNWYTSLFAINLVCKQLHAETVLFLYRKTVFVFDSPRRIINFLNAVSASKLEHITELHLHHETYGSPRLTTDCIWQEKHARCWMRACHAAAKKLVGLQKLKMWIRLCDDSVRFNLRETWVTPLLQFRRLSVPVNTRPQQKQRLAIVNIKLCTRWSNCSFAGNQELAKASQDLHQLFGHAIALAILGSKEETAMAKYNAAWEVKYSHWQHHLNYGVTGW